LARFSHRLAIPDPEKKNLPMPVIAVVNRKGGSGKSTFAAHVAAWCARRGHAVMLGDIDRQQSSRGWLRRRPAELPVISPWTLDQNVLRVPTGITHAVLDTPGGLHGFELARVVMFADAIVMPVCASIFDRESAAQCYAELMALPRVARGQCRVAAVGMRVDGRTNAAEVLRQWAQAQELPFLGILRETQMYVRTLERGLTIFDLPPSQAATDLAQWEPILQWLQPVMEPPQAANDTQGVAVSRLGGARPSRPKPPPKEALVHGGGLAVLSGARSFGAPQPQPQAAARPALARDESAGTRLQIPQFLKR
jgi:chromosome partitioning protein